MLILVDNPEVLGCGDSGLGATGDLTGSSRFVKFVGLSLLKELVSTVSGSWVIRVSFDDATNAGLLVKIGEWEVTERCVGEPWGERNWGLRQKLKEFQHLWKQDLLQLHPHFPLQWEPLLSCRMNKVCHDRLNLWCRNFHSIWKLKVMVFYLTRVPEFINFNEAEYKITSRIKLMSNVRHKNMTKAIDLIYSCELNWNPITALICSL